MAAPATAVARLKRQLKQFNKQLQVARLERAHYKKKSMRLRHTVDDLTLQVKERDGKIEKSRGQTKTVNTHATLVSKRLSAFERLYHEQLQTSVNLKKERDELDNKNWQLQDYIATVADSLQHSPPSTALAAADRGVNILLDIFGNSGMKKRVLCSIKHLVSVPGGQQLASTYVLTFADKHVAYILEQRAVAEETDGVQWYDENITPTYFANIDELLCKDILSPNWKALAYPTQDNGWNSGAIIKNINDVNKKISADFDEPLELLGRSLALVHGCEMRRLSAVVAMKAVGHKLPPELVELVRDCICGEEEVMALLA